MPEPSDCSLGSLPVPRSSWGPEVGHARLCLLYRVKEKCRNVGLLQRLDFSVWERRVREVRPSGGLEGPKLTAHAPARGRHMSLNFV